VTGTGISRDARVVYHTDHQPEGYGFTKVGVALGDNVIWLGSNNHRLASPDEMHEYERADAIAKDIVIGLRLAAVGPVTDTERHMLDNHRDGHDVDPHTVREIVRVAQRFDVKRGVK
jgi:hypothetical protein